MASDKADSDSMKLARITLIWDVLVEKLQHVDALVEQLGLTGTLSKNQVEEISCKQTPREKKGKLLDIIRMKGAYDIFSHCLRVSGQDELYQLMVDKVRVQFLNDELTTLQYRVFSQHGTGDPRKLQVPPHLSDRLEKQREALQGMKNVESLVDLMEDEGCMTTEITGAIKGKPDNKEKAQMLVHHVKKSTLYSFILLVRFLDISQQKELMSKISEKDTETALGRMDDLLLNVYYNLLGAIALKESVLEARLGVKARDFVNLSINRNSKAVDRRGLDEAHVDCSLGREIELTELFSDRANKKPTRTVLLVGAPGVGKTTAIKQLAREAANKRTPHIPRPPFVIQLRSVDWTTETSLKRLLLRYGPDLAETEQADLWRALLGKASEITVILDGADEVTKGFFVNNPARVTGEDIQASPQFILNNLISGNLLTGAQVLVSSRPHGLAECWDYFDRKVEVSGFNVETLDCFLNNELPPQHLNEVQSFLATHVDIRSLLLTPLHAAIFVLRGKDIQNTDDLLLQSRTELSLSLIDFLVKTNLHKKHQKAIPEDDLEKQGENLHKLCKLVAELLCREGAIKTQMTRTDLKKAKITVKDCVATGVFSEQVLDEGDVYRSILMVPHQSILESLAALGLDEQQIIKLAVDNDGRYDLVLTYVAGVLGNVKNRRMLDYVLGDEDEEQDFKKLAEVAVRAVLGSKRRALHGGEEFCQRIVIESQQWDLIADLVCVMKTRWLTSDSSERLMLYNQLIGHDPGKDTCNQLIKVQVVGIHNIKYCPWATALVHDDEVSATDIEKNAEHLHKISSVNFYSAGIKQETVAGIAGELSQLNNVEAVDMEYNKVESASSEKSSDLSCLSLIPSLQYLTLSRCDLTSADVVAVTSSCRRLRHLDISENRSVRGGDVIRRQLTGLSVRRCELEGDELVEMVASNGEALEFLNATYYNTVLSANDISSILTRCPRLVEMYGRGGGELVRALSERHAVCLKHLWLPLCELSSSSSSSSCYQVNSSGLCDVLMRHQSITSLTLFHCHPFTSDIMHLLSSSMASITSLFISPHPVYHRQLNSSDVASVLRASPGLTQFWLGGVHDEWLTSDYITVVHAVNSSPALRVVGLNVKRLSADDVLVVIRELRLLLTRLWLVVDDKKMEEYVEVAGAGELGVVQLVSDYALYYTYERESGLFYQHLPPSLPRDFRPAIF